MSPLADVDMAVETYVNERTSPLFSQLDFKDEEIARLNQIIADLTDPGPQPHAFVGVSRSRYNAFGTYDIYRCYDQTDLDGAIAENAKAIHLSWTEQNLNNVAAMLTKIPQSIHAFGTFAHEPEQSGKPWSTAGQKANYRSIWVDQADVMRQFNVVPTLCLMSWTVKSGKNPLEWFPGFEAMRRANGDPGTWSWDAYPEGRKKVPVEYTPPADILPELWAYNDQEGMNFGVGEFGIPVSGDPQIRADWVGEYIDFAGDNCPVDLDFIEYWNSVKLSGGRIAGPDNRLDQLTADVLQQYQLEA